MNVMNSSEAPYCPTCESRDYVIPIIYQKPTKELLRQWSKGEIELGGVLMIHGTQPPWTCMRCKILICLPKDFPQKKVSQDPV
ncbi:MAG: hypothetical protein AAB972_03880 [Patescibacteria group bacterium]